MGSDPVTLRLPLPYPIGEVNVHVLRGDPLTLVDAGSGWTPGARALERGLAEHGLRVEDIELLILTHHHDDHVGLAETIRVRSGCSVAAHALVAELMAHEKASRAREGAYAKALLALHGAPREVVADAQAISTRAGAYVRSVRVDRPLVDGDVLRAGGRDVTACLRPGHSPTDTVFVDEAGLALVGDHLLHDVAPALLPHHRSAADGDPRSRPALLPLYRRSLAETRALGAARALTGHGEAITDVTALIDRRLAEQDERVHNLARRLPDRPATAWEMVAGLWPRRGLDSTGHPVSIPFVVVCDLLAQLDLLEQQGAVQQRTGDDGLVRWNRRPSGSGGGSGRCRGAASASATVAPSSAGRSSPRA